MEILVRKYKKFKQAVHKYITTKTHLIETHIHSWRIKTPGQRSKINLRYKHKNWIKSLTIEADTVTK